MIASQIIPFGTFAVATPVLPSRNVLHASIHIMYLMADRFG